MRYRTLSKDFRSGKLVDRSGSVQFRLFQLERIALRLLQRVLVSLLTTGNVSSSVWGNVGCRTERDEKRKRGREVESSESAISRQRSDI